MLLAQAPAVPRRISREQFDAEVNRRGEAAKRLQAERSKLEDQRDLLKGVDAVMKLRRWDIPGAIGLLDNRVGLFLTVSGQVDRGAYADALLSVLATKPGAASLINVGRSFVQGDPIGGVGNIVATKVGLAFCGLLCVPLAKSAFNLARKSRPPSLDEDTRALYQRFEEADREESERIIAAIRGDTQALEADTARVSAAAEIIGDFKFPGEFIGEGEALPANVLAATPAVSETGEPGFTPVVALTSEDDAVFDEAYQDYYDQVIDQIAQAQAGEGVEEGEALDAYLDGRLSLPVAASLPLKEVLSLEELRCAPGMEAIATQQGDEELMRLCKGMDALWEQWLRLPRNAPTAADYEYLRQYGETYDYDPISREWYTKRDEAAKIAPFDAAPAPGPAPSPGTAPAYGPGYAPAYGPGYAPAPGPGYAPAYPRTATAFPGPAPYSGRAYDDFEARAETLPGVPQGAALLPGVRERAIVERGAAAPGAASDLVEQGKPRFPWWLVIGAVILSS